MKHKNIIIAVDFSDSTGRVVDAAKEIMGACAPDAKIHLLHVFNRTPYPGPREIYEQVAEQIHDDLQKQMDSLHQKEFSSSKSVDSMLIDHPSPAIGIVEKAEEEHADLIVIGCRGNTGLTRMLLGSVAEMVVREAKCSVWVVR